jgi:hypothetical protein
VDPRRKLTSNRVANRHARGAFIRLLPPGRPR